MTTGMAVITAHASIVHLIWPSKSSATAIVKDKSKFARSRTLTKVTLHHSFARLQESNRSCNFIDDTTYLLVCDPVPTVMATWLTSDDVLSFKTGLTHDDVDSVWRLVDDVLVKHYAVHHERREPPLSPFASLLATLYWLREYPTTRCMAAELDTNQTIIIEAIEHTMQVLLTTLVPAYFCDSALPHRAYSEGCLSGVRLVIDSTFLILPHHSDAEERKRCYHMKSPTRQALKWQLAVTTDGVPFHISDVVYGSKADVTLLRESGLLDRLTGETRALGDKGYVGEPKVVTPMKKPRLAELKEEDKKENKTKHSKRVVVENCFHEFKRWTILGGEYRGDIKEAKDLQHASRIVHVIAALVKRRLAKHPIRARPAATV